MIQFQINVRNQKQLFVLMRVVVAAMLGYTSEGHTSEKELNLAIAQKITYIRKCRLYCFC